MRRRIGLWLWILGLTLACVFPPATQPPPGASSQPPPLTETATPFPTVPPTALQPETPTPEPPDTGWQTLRPGWEWRSLPISVSLELDLSGSELPPAPVRVERMTILRIDPAAARFRVLYASEQPRRISEWAHQTSARLVLNGGYFTEENLATGLLISDGRRYGTSYEDFAGMFVVPTGGPAAVRWLRATPYDPAEPLDQAVQGFPLLLKPGGVMAFPADADEGQIARRTVVAQDRQGRILFLIARRGYFSLHALSVWLSEADLELDLAVNLDGGPSSGLWLPDTPALQIDSATEIPAVIVIE